MGKDGDRVVSGLNKLISNYQSKVRSPHNVALVKDLELTDTLITVLRDFQWHCNCGLRSSLPQKNRIRVR